MARDPVVFISSTSEDLEAHREQARQAALCSGFAPRMMEYSPATGHVPSLTACREKVAEAEVVVVLVAHRYGWVPDDPENPEGKSITWLECDYARDVTHKEVLAFLVDPNHRWPVELYENYRLVRSLKKEPAEILQIVEEVNRNVEKLARFKKELSAYPCGNFTNAESVLHLVTVALFEWKKRQDFKVDGKLAATTRGVGPEKCYRDRLLLACDIVDLAGLPEQDRHRALKHQDLKLRCLYIRLRLRTEIGTKSRAHAEANIGQKLLEVDWSRADYARSGDIWTQDETVWWELERGRAKALGETLIDGEDSEGGRLSVGAALRKTNRLVILGEAGAGKTTLTRWIATAYILRLKKSDDWTSLPDAHTLPDTYWLPIVVFCRDLDLSAIAGSLDDILKHILRKSELTDDGITSIRELMLERLESGTALLMFDGLDEIADAPARTRFCLQLETISAAYPKAPIIVTSRIVGYRETGRTLGPGFEHLTLADLTPNDKDDFVRRWVTLTEPPETRDAAASQLIRDIHSSDRIERLTNNPMLLTTIALIKRKVGKLPNNRVDLYWEAVQVLLNWRRAIDKPVEWREALPQLEYLAYAMSDRGAKSVCQDEILDLLSNMRREYPALYEVRNRTPREFLEAIEARTGLLVQTGQVRHLGRQEPLYEFRHLTFQEYLAARSLVDGYFPGCDPRQSLGDQVGRLAGRTAETTFSEDGPSETAVVKHWSEALRLCASLCHQKDVDSVLLATLMPQKEESASVVRARTILAAFCLADEPNVSEAVATQVFDALIKQVRKPDGGGSVLMRQLMR